jgi:hypothetical protein
MFRLFEFSAFDHNLHRNAFLSIQHQKILFQDFLNVFEIYGWKSEIKFQDKLVGNENIPPKENFYFVLSLLKNSMFLIFFINSLEMILAKKRRK